ncbi:hypothetical protein F383_24589 [Gossypium arboreum]|uniref:Uncharacterized protein n=1 Tax=Gossypium arboreum TaxID=29729 RepID=A0A0B0P5Z1_GOSAR|nr:hypothetical protein F383_24589 [Gossypium arboreum]
MPCPRHSLTLTLVYRGQCHVPDMVLHWLSSIGVDAMFQTWSYTSSHIWRPMPCPRHGLTQAHISP